MSNLFNRVKAVLTSRDEKIADLSARLAEALANDAADAEAIAAAQAAAAEAAENVARLQELADADAAEDEQINELLSSYEEETQV